jgi:hypothetical protein
MPVNILMKRSMKKFQSHHQHLDAGDRVSVPKDWHMCVASSAEQHDLLFITPALLAKSKSQGADQIVQTRVPID